DRRDVNELLVGSWPTTVSLALGEPGMGLAGWRTSHRQASAAFPIAVRGGKQVVRYADVAILSSMIRDDLLVSSLHALCLAPLADGADGGAVARETLHAYFCAERNVSSAAAALGVTRRTVSNRLRAIEERVALSVDAIEIEVALRLEGMERQRNEPVPTCEQKTFVGSHIDMADRIRRGHAPAR
ncbi:MAG TPA: helix-turn-helix domain-containing protein, partial [Solirubrobacterales bacterium]|nr:helix-turn-helix domain-containing protein [Solirubrobacterales bacterium]